MHPQLFHFGRLVVPTYGVSLAVSAIVALLLCVRTARLLALDSDKVWSVALVVVFTTVVVSRAAVILYNWPRYGARALGLSALSAETSGPGIIGAVFAIAAAVVYARRSGLPILRTADAFAPSLALATSIVSVGCLEAGCNYGTPSRLPWAIIFRNRAAMPGTPLGVPLHPTQLYISMVQFTLFAGLLALIYHVHNDGEVIGAWLFLAGLSNFLLSFLLGDPGPALAGVLPVTQIVAAAMVLAGGFLWLQRPQLQTVSYGG